MIKFLFTILLSLSYIKPLPMESKKIINTNELTLHTESAIMIEAASGKVIYEKNADDKHYPASMTKMMGMYLVLKNIQEGKLSFDDIVTCSSYASSMGGTQIYLEPNEKMSVRDLFKAVAINSANDAITALAEHISGNVTNFVKLMNNTAKELKMTNTTFKNPTGFDDQEHLTTPRDMALIAFHLVAFGEDLFQFTRLKEAYIREDTDKPFWLVNTNKMLSRFEGMDGLKTGYTSLAKYNLTATAKRDGVRLISVVMNEKTIKEREEDTQTLLNTGFSKLKCQRIYKAEDIIAHYTFKNAKQINTPLYVKKEVSLIVDKDESLEDLKARIQLLKTYAPLKENEVVGILIITDSYNQEYYFDIMVKESVTKKAYMDFFKDSLLHFLS